MTLETGKKAPAAIAKIRDAIGWEPEATEAALTSLARGYAEASRMEESNAWRNPIDLIALLDDAFAALPAALDAGRARAGHWNGGDALVPVILGDDPSASITALLDALRAGCSPEDLAGLVAYVSSKFSNRLLIVDPDPNGDGDPVDALIAGSVSLVRTSKTAADDTIVGNAGMGGQGILPIPVVYNGWVQKLPPTWKNQLTPSQQNPFP